jgi:hypothetical protein
MLQQAESVHKGNVLSGSLKFALLTREYLTAVYYCHLVVLLVATKHYVSRIMMELLELSSSVVSQCLQSFVGINCAVFWPTCRLHIVVLPG